MLSLRGILQESASHAMHGAGGLSVPTGGRELADPWCHVCGRVCEFALKSFVLSWGILLSLIIFITKSRCHLPRDKIKVSNCAFANVFSKQEPFKTDSPTLQNI